MIVNIFRHSQTTSIAIILSLCVFIWMGISFDSLDISKESSNFFYNFLISPIELNSIFKRGILGILIFWQCILMNKMMVKEKIISTNSFFPAFFYFLLISISPQIIYLNPTIISMVFLILALTKILSSYLDKNAYSKVFESAILISLAGLIHSPFIVFIPIVWIGMSIFSQVEWRHWVLSIIGIICPWYIMFSIATFYSIEHSSFSSSLLFLFEEGPKYSSNLMDFICLTIFGLICFIALAELMMRLKQKNIKARKSYILLLWFIPFSVIYFLVSNDFFYMKLIVSAIPLSAAISNYFYHHKNKNLLNFLILSLVIVVISNHLLG